MWEVSCYTAVNLIKLPVQCFLIGMGIDTDLANQIPLSIQFLIDSHWLGFESHLHL